MKRYDLVLDPTGECDCCRLELFGGKFVLFDDHAAAIAEKDAEIARLKEEIKHLNHLLDKAQVLRGEDADTFLERVEAVDRGDIPKPSNRHPGIDYEKLHAILAERKKQREQAQKQPEPRYDDVYFAGVEALDKM